MGRGRAKAKQTKVARDLKYRTFDTDFTSLERELGSKPSDSTDVQDDDYAEYADRYGAGEDDEDDDEDAPDYGRRIV